MGQGAPFRDLPCLVCHAPCHTEGQLCPDCVAAGATSNDDSVTITLELRLPDFLK